MLKLAALIFIMLPAAPAFAIDPLPQANGNVQSDSVAHAACRSAWGLKISGCTSGTRLDSGTTPYIKTIINAFLYVGAAVSFFFVIIGGIRYITATGDPKRIQAAKDTLLYAIIGLIVSSFAIPITAFVVEKLK